MDIDEYAMRHLNRDVDEKILDSQLEVLFENNPKFVLEIGCGDGALALAVLERFRFVEKYYACDISAKRLERLRDFAVERGLLDRLILLQDIEELPKTEKIPFDLIVSEQVIEHVDDEDRFLEAIASISADKSIVYISTIFINVPGYYFYKNETGQRVLDPTHVREYRDRQLLDKCRKAGLSVLSEDYEKVYYPLSSLVKKIITRFGIKLDLGSRWWLRLPGYFNWRLVLIRSNDIRQT